MQDGTLNPLTEEFIFNTIEDKDDAFHVLLAVQQGGNLELLRHDLFMSLVKARGDVYGFIDKGLAVDEVTIPDEFQSPTDLLTTEIMVLRERVEELEDCLGKCKDYFQSKGNQYHQIIESLINK